MISIYEATSPAQVSCAYDARAVPAKGRSLSGMVEARQRDLIKVAAIIESAILDQERLTMAYKNAFLDGITETGRSSGGSVDLQTRAIWAVLELWIVRLGAVGTPCSLDEALGWFFCELPELAERISSNFDHAKLQILTEYAQGFCDDPLLMELAPYTFDPNSRGSRLDVMFGRASIESRKKRKEKGAYYTPLDVAHVMTVNAVNGRPSEEEIKMIDTACGGGVFLRTFFRVYIQDRCAAIPRLTASQALELLVSSVHGCDIEPLAVDSCAFVLLAEILKHGELAPFAAWLRIRKNLVVVDSLAIRMAPNSLNFENLSFDHHSLTKLFPGINQGFNLMLGNPPYAPLGESTGIASDGLFTTLGIKPKASHNSFIPFVELAWSILTPDASLALVLPLSIAYNRTQSYSALRKRISGDDGSWAFAFFDREPHALFGEDVKTRNALVFRNCGTWKNDDFGVTELIRFTGRNRLSKLESISFTAVPRRHATILLPKLPDPQATELYVKLCSPLIRLKKPLFSSISSVPPESVFENVESCLFLCGTSYSFIGCYPNLAEKPQNIDPLADSKLIALRFDDDLTRWAAYAILSSRIVFWHWLTVCDGFHVTRWFIEELGLLRSIYSRKQLGLLTELGRLVWEESSQDPIVSVNGGKKTINFRQTHFTHSKDQIDTVILDALELSSQLSSSIAKHIKTTLVADPDCPRRQSAFSKYFQKHEI